MAQIKYVVFACLIFFVGWLAITSFQKILSSRSRIEFSDVPATTNQKPTVIIGPEVIRGAELFKEHCGSCHGIGKMDEGSRMERLMQTQLWAEDQQNLIKFIRDPKSFIPTTQYTRELSKQYGQIMPSFLQLTNEDLEDLYQFLVYLNIRRR